MTTYQLVPYLISVKPRGTHGGELRPLADVDAEGTSLQALIGYTLGASIGKGPWQFPKNDLVNFRVESVFEEGRALFFRVTQGSKGIQSRLNDGPKQVFTRESAHVEDIDFRNMIIFPRSGKRAVWLAERIGNNGTAQFTQKLLRDSLGANFDRLTIEIQPLTTAADLELTDIALRSIEFKFPGQSDPGGKFLDMAKADGYFSLKWRFRAKKKLSNFTDSSGKKLDPSKIFGVIDAGAQQGLTVGGERLKELGAQADLNVTLPAGNQRTFTMGLDEGPALAYPIEPSSKSGSSSTPASVDRFRPSDTDFLRVAKGVVSEVSPSLGVSEAAAKDCAVAPADAEKVGVKPPDGWKVEWHVPDHLAPDPS